MPRAQKPEKGSRGRPTLYTDAIAAEIIDRLGHGEPLQAICRSEHMPSATAVYEWINEKSATFKPQFSADFAQARARGFDAIAADTLRIADTPVEGVEYVLKANGDTEEKRGDMLGHRKLQIETRLKLLAKWDPKRYGERLAVGGSDDMPAIKTEVTTHELARRAAYLLQAGVTAQEKPRQAAS